MKVQYCRSDAVRALLAKHGPWYCVIAGAWSFLTDQHALWQEKENADTNDGRYQAGSMVHFR